MWADNASRVDMLSYEPYAELLYDISMTERVNPLTVGLLGNWGSGKSTVLNLIEEKIKKEQTSSVITVFVNAWMFEGYDDAKTALMEVILRTLEENETIMQQVGEALKNLREKVDWFRLGGYAIKKGVPYMLNATLGNPFPMIVDGIKALVPKEGKQTEELIAELMKTKEFIKDQPQDNVVQNIRGFRKDFEQMMSDSKLDNLIIIIDDLDRCSPERIIETLEAIRLFLAVKKTTFIIAIDEDVVSYAVQSKYPKIDDATLNISKDYIEKIIQMPIRIPELSDNDVKNYLKLLICEIFLKDDHLTRLLIGLKERQVFVKGEIISQDEILTILALEEYTEEQVFRTGSTKSDFELQLDVFSKVAEIIASTLKGNPRQAKRFLNTFYIRKRLSELQGLQLDLSILAKLMVLEYTHVDLFRELYVWHVKNEGYARELEDLINFSLEDATESDQLKQKYSSTWFKPIIQQWLKVEPVNIHEEDLRQYFYLAKEAIKEKNISMLNLTAEERKWVNDICTEGLNEALRKQKIEVFSKCENIDHSRVIKGIIAKYHSNREANVKVLIGIYEQFSNFRGEILKEIKKLRKEDFSPPIVKNFNTIKGISNQDYEELKKYFFDEGKVDRTFWERIVNPRG
ncbi:KAP family P-loop NTPase fold protein [Bacillus velezensis]|uniref:KAP family P-loop NTPase fold protein n=1 Tax=Bacillus velezensis TaxID=492670 RepID=UPI002DBCB4F7|nr:P-loop NTPase fold protein [Bacillus velezensis]MEC1564075.1 P-loop NTPase fold protein [Bacillus velezensis]